jgi:hypothetical protein
MGETPKFSFETLKADDVGRRLRSANGRHEVAAKVIGAEDGEQFLSVRVWIGSEARDDGGGWSEPSAWSHTVYDPDHNIVAYGFGARERDSWAMVERILGKKLGAVNQGRLGTPPQNTPGNDPGEPTLPDTDPSKFTWYPGDLDLLTPEEAAQILGPKGGLKTQAEKQQHPTETVLFSDDEEGYVAWLAANPTGFVLNAYRNPSPGYLKLHRASCRTINGEPTRGKLWTADYLKVCSNSPDTLRTWINDHVPGGKPDECSHCLGNGTTRGET